MRGARAVGLVALLLATPAAGAGAAPVEVPPAGPLVESLTFDASGDRVTMFLRTTVPVPRFACTLPTPSAPEVIIEMQEAGSRLQSRYLLDNPLVREAVVEAGLQGGAGVRIRVPLAAAELVGVEQVERGLVFRFAPRREPPGAATTGTGEEYRIGPGDKIDIAVFGHEDMNRSNVEVRGDGTINLSLIGSLVVAGRTPSQVDEQITAILAKDFLVDPQVTVDVREYHSQWVTLIGEVKSPGRYVLKRDMRLIDLLADAGGASREAGSEIIITRNQNGAGDNRQIVIDRERLLSRDNRDSNVLLQHGDIVTVSEQEVFYIRGEVTKPGSYFLSGNMTVLKAVSLAGGLTPFANRREIELLRTGSGGVSDRTVVNLKAIEEGKRKDVPLHPNDIIIVPRRIF